MGTDLNTRSCPLRTSVLSREGNVRLLNTKIVTSKPPKAAIDP